MIVRDQPGTTRDSVSIPLDRDGRAFELVDTAGVRRRQKVTETVEHFSVVRTIRAIERAHVCVLMLDARAEPGEQDAAIAGLIEGRGRSIVVVVNKWDNLDAYTRKQFPARFERRFPFLPPHERLLISALHGTAVGDVLPAVARAFESATIRFATSDLNRRLEAAVDAQAPPMHAGHAIKPKFAHPGRLKSPVGDHLRQPCGPHPRILRALHRQLPAGKLRPRRNPDPGPVRERRKPLPPQAVPRSHCPQALTRPRSGPAGRDNFRGTVLRFARMPGTDPLLAGPHRSGNGGSARFRFTGDTHTDFGRKVKHHAWNQSEGSPNS
ncbi:MAG: GTP-binding protein [Gammaproteobacteria bacterium]|nr:GTP-binding protein [Gammaproteobacteria bacterium]